MMTTTNDFDLTAYLSAAGVSDVLLPGDKDYVSELAGFNIALAHTPIAVVRAHSVAEVSGAVDAARAARLPITVLGHGHGMLGPISGGIAISTKGLAGVEINETERTAQVGAGTTWSQVLDAATPFGLAALCGSAPHVGVMGYLLGGGIGPVARTFGFAADHVRSLTVVTADGSVLVASPATNRDLFWALRGGKGGFGVVVEAVIDLFPMASLFGGGLYFAGDDTRRVLHRFSEWSADLPETITASVSLLRLPPLPQLPEPIRGQFVAHLRIAFVGDAVDAERVLAPMLEVATPLLGGLGSLPYAAIGSIHADPVDPMPVLEGGILLAGFETEAVDALLAAVGPEMSVPLAAVEVRLLGGALSREPAEPNAVGGRDAAYSLHVVGAPVPDLFDQVIPDVIRGVFAALAPFATGGTQINFFGAVNDQATIEHSWSPATAERLALVREIYDPLTIFPFGPARP